jgi:hypothetical protein
VGREVNTRLAWQLADSVVEEMREIRDRRGVKPRPRYWPKRSTTT